MLRDVFRDKILKMDSDDERVKGVRRYKFTEIWIGMPKTNFMEQVKKENL